MGETISALAAATNGVAQIGEWQKLTVKSVAGLAWKIWELHSAAD